VFAKAMSGTRGKQTPLDAVAKLQRVGIVDIILWLVLRLWLGYRREVEACTALTLSGSLYHSIREKVDISGTRSHVGR